MTSVHALCRWVLHVPQVHRVALFCSVVGETSTDQTLVNLSHQFSLLKCSCYWGQWLKGFLTLCCKFLLFGGKTGHLVKTTESAVKADSRQKRIKGPTSASMCWLLTDTDMKCFLSSQLLFSCFVICCFTFVLLILLSTPRPRRVLHIVKMKWM